MANFFHVLLLELCSLSKALNEGREGTSPYSEARRTNVDPIFSSLRKPQMD